MKKTRYILLLFVIGIITVNTICLNLKNTINEKEIRLKNNVDYTVPIEAADPFYLLQDLNTSTYYISPDSSPGIYDNATFSFMANRDGNYTFQIENFPSFLTNTESQESFLSFDNPSGTDLWYLVCEELDQNNIGQFNFKMLFSEDKGKIWRSSIIKSIYANVEDVFDLLFYVSGTAIAANPETGMIVVTTWINRTDLKLLRSFDNGTTWSDPIQIRSSEEMGTEAIFSSMFSHPRFDIGIKGDGTIMIVSEAEDSRFTRLVYTESYDNGTTWTVPRNVTSTTGLNAKLPKIQIDRSSGNYWLMWLNYTSYPVKINDTIQWAQYQSTQNLFDNVQYKNATSYRTFGNYDFYFDHRSNKFKFIYLESDVIESKTYMRVENWTCDDFNANVWSGSILGFFQGLGALYTLTDYINYIVNEDNIIFFVDNYLGNSDVFQYNIIEDYEFWVEKGDFNEYILKEIFWNGKKTDLTSIKTSLVKARLSYQNNTIERETILYIMIDNTDPLFMFYTQPCNYFNPLSSDISISKMIWNLHPLESCEALLEISRKQSYLGGWSQVSGNNWEDSDPKIFLSNTGIMFIIYESYESGRNKIYLTKSTNQGVIWNNPILIYETSYLIDSFTGAASGDNVSIYLQDADNRRLFFRSFNQGETFQNPINIHNETIFPMGIYTISDLIMTNNGTMFLSFRNRDDYLKLRQYHIIRSNDYGKNWMNSSIFPCYSDKISQALDPELAYDSLNDIVFISMPNDNMSSLDYTRTMNFSFSTFNFTNNEWSPIINTDIVPGSLFTQDPKFLITRDNITATPEIRLIYLENVELPEINFYYKEFVSYDLGASWLGPNNITLPNFSDLTSNLDDTFYINTQSDGNDKEIFINREGKFVKSEEILLSSTLGTEITFDGINEFGNYIIEGNYSYNLELIDYAGNNNTIEGWFYVDYSIPLITNISTNWDITPIPRYDVEITVNATDHINFSTYIYYKRDGGNWQNILMTHKYSDFYSATIPGDSQTLLIEYYIKTIDLAGNQYILDNQGSNYRYDKPNYIWESEGLFKDTKSYSSSKEYEIEIEILNDIEYIQKIILKYSYDEGDSWDDLELEQGSPVFSGTLDDIPGDLRQLYYKIVITDIFGNEVQLTDTEKIDFYPEVPEIEFTPLGVTLLIIISATIGFMVAFGYIRLKKTSHELISKHILYRDVKKKTELSENTKKKGLFKTQSKSKKEEHFELSKEIFEKSKITMPFTMAYLGILLGTVIMFSLGLFISGVVASLGILILAGSLLLGVYGYMILMSRDITINIYLEKIFKRNVILETVQMAFLFINIVVILLVGYSMDWFRYYLVESTFDFGDMSIPRLYLSVIGVFFTSLVLVIITTYIQLRKTVFTILRQRTQGATENLLLFSKDQNSSKLITHMGYKTIIFLVTVLLGVVTTTNLLTYNTGIALVIILIPFISAGFAALIANRIMEKKKREKEKDETEMLFVDSQKFCTKCGNPSYLSDRYCQSCGNQLIFSEMLGKYVDRCSECNSFIKENAKFCSECGKRTKLNIKD